MCMVCGRTLGFNTRKNLVALQLCCYLTLEHYFSWRGWGMLIHSQLREQWLAHSKRFGDVRFVDCTSSRCAASFPTSPGSFYSVKAPCSIGLHAVSHLGNLLFFPTPGHIHPPHQIRAWSCLISQTLSDFFPQAFFLSSHLTKDREWRFGGLHGRSATNGQKATVAPAFLKIMSLCWELVQGAVSHGGDGEEQVWSDSKGAV